MTRFQDGPAQGKTLMLRRAPIYLRVTELIGEFDALDQLNDQPEPGETLHCYVLAEAPGHIHINTGRKPGGGFFPMALYRIVPEQPPQEIMRDNAKWRAWTNKQPRPEFPK